jgi:hypothetical protein
METPLQKAMKMRKKITMLLSKVMVEEDGAEWF